MDEKKPTAIVNADAFKRVREYAKRQREHLSFDASKLTLAENQYVAWIDLMGAGNIMSISIAKSANFLIRLHMAAKQAVDSSPDTVETCAINDGIFFVSNSKRAIMSVVRQVFYTLASYFISTAAPHDKFLLRGSIAFGPVYGGKNLQSGLSKTKAEKYASSLTNVQFGPAIIQAYRQEAFAPPYGVAVHESARAFAPNGCIPFRETHWLWWSALDELDWPEGVASLREIARCLGSDLSAHFDWMKSKALFQGVDKAKIDHWSEAAEQYFSLA